jgi:hypothetical protein
MEGTGMGLRARLLIEGDVHVAQQSWWWHGWVLNGKCVSSSTLTISRVLRVLCRLTIGMLWWSETSLLLWDDERVTEILFGSTDELNPPNDRNNDSGPPFSNYGILGGFSHLGFLFLDCLQCAPIAYWFMKFVLLVKITSCSRGYSTGEVWCENELEFKTRQKPCHILEKMIDSSFN